VTAVLGEVARAVSRGGLFVLHEPVVSMGDWRARRPGLTKNERGLPLGWLERTLRAAGFAVERRAFCGFPATARLGALLRTSAFNSPLLVRLDAAASSLLAWNLRYHRDAPWKKLSPTSAFFLLRRQ